MVSILASRKVSLAWRLVFTALMLDATFFWRLKRAARSRSSVILVTGDIFEGLLCALVFPKITGVFIFSQRGAVDSVEERMLTSYISVEEQFFS
jgi:hypothetical protein